MKKYVLILFMCVCIEHINNIYVIKCHWIPFLAQSSQFLPVLDCWRVGRSAHAQMAHSHTLLQGDRRTLDE